MTVLLTLGIILWIGNTVDGQGGIPSTPSNLGTSNVSSTFITLTWRHPSQENVDIFMVNFTFQIIGCPGDTGHRDDELSPSDTLVEGDMHQYNLTNVQEDSDYTFFVAAKNSVGQSSATSITRRTGLAGASSPPRDVMITETTPTTVKVTWQRVRCVNRNADITNYVVQYVGVFESRGFSVPDDPREYTFTGLVPWTNYTIAVAAQHINLRENPPVFLIGAEQEVTASTLPVQELGLFHGGMLLPNNTVLSSVDQQGLFCLTTNTRCCEGNVSSHWFLPGGSDPVINIEEATSSDKYRVTQRPGAIALATKLTGIRGSPLPFARGVYTCRIPGANGGTRTLYAGVKLDPSIIISDLSFSDATNLVCTSTGRPVNSITWLRNGQVIDFETDSTFTSTQTLIDPVDAVYLNVLSSQNASSFVGTFTCRLTDAEESPTPVERVLNVNDVTISNDDFIVGTTATANCTSSADTSTIDHIIWTNTTGHILFFTNSSNLLALTFDPVKDNQEQGEFTCSVRRGEEVANQSFQVALIAPEEPLSVMILNTSGPSVAGSPFNVTCVVMERVPGLSNQPTATWLNSDREPVPTHQGASTSSFSNSTHAISVLSFQSLLVSQGSQYTCVGSLRLAFLETDVSAEQPYRVVVNLPPPEVSIESSGPYYLGERTTLMCTARALPQVDRGTIVRSFMWITEGEEVSDSSPGFEITPSQLTSQLTIVSLGVSDTNFTCSATIHLGSNSMRVSPQASAFHAITFELSDPSVEIISSPATSNLYAGLQLNLTCVVHVTSAVDTSPAVTVTWLRNNTRLESDGRITVQGTPVQTSQPGASAGQFESRVVFESLEIEDIGTYSCFANLSLSAGNFAGSASSNVTQQQIAIARECVQLRINFGDDFDCMDVNRYCNAINFSILFDSVVETINSECGNCGFSNKTVTDIGCRCFPNNPSHVTVHMKIQGTPGRNVSRLVDLIENFVESGDVELITSGRIYNLSTDAAVSIQSVNGICVPVDDTPPIMIMTVEDDGNDSTVPETITTTGGVRINPPYTLTVIILVMLSFCLV